MNDSYLLKKTNVLALPIDYHAEERCTTIIRNKCKGFNSGQNAFTGLRLVN